MAARLTRLHSLTGIRLASQRLAPSRPFLTAPNFMKRALEGKGLQTSQLSLSLRHASSSSAASTGPGAPSKTMAAPPSSSGQVIKADMRGKGVLVLRLDSPGEKVNTLNEATMREFEPLIARIETDDTVRAVVITSEKPDNFIAGADIAMLERCTSAEELSALARRGSALFDRLARSRKPVLAAINGTCLGGGLELALACHYRIATSHPKTKLGLPEVMLGLLPGASGTQRLPRLIGLQAAIEAMTTGRQYAADKAVRVGLVDEVVDPSALQAVAVRAAEELAESTLKPAAAGRKPTLQQWALERNPLGRRLLFAQAGKAVAKATGGRYPAPVAILEAVRSGVEKGLQAGLDTEARLFGVLGMTPESAALRGLYHAQTASKKNPYKKEAAAPPPPPGSPEGSGPRVVGVLGAGLMGAGIASVTASSGLRVVLKDRDGPGLGKGMAHIEAMLRDRLRRKQVTAMERDTTLSRIAGVTEGDPAWRRHMAACDLVVEAVPEVLALKHAVIQQVEPLLPPSAVIATNTSALPIASIAAAASRPERVVGMHYFSPVEKMPLLELIPHSGTAPSALAAAYELGLKQGKTIIVVKDVAGFYVNKALGPWASEALLLVQRGMDPLVLDAACKRFGYPVGPVALADEVGLDVLYHTLGTLKASLGHRLEGANEAWLKALVDGGILGRKAGRGFMLYPAASGGSGGGGGEGKAGGGGSGIVASVSGALSRLVAFVTGAGGSGGKGGTQVNPAALALTARTRSGEDAATPPEVAVERMVLRFVSECIHSLQDGVISSPADGDLGAVFGLGFPPFLGGPFRYVDTLGAAKVVERMRRLGQEQGSARFDPPQALLDLARIGGKFHPK